MRMNLKMWEFEALKRKGMFFFGIFFFLFNGGVSAQSFSASASKTTVGVGERFQVTFSVDGSGSGFQAPSFSDFNVLMGPSQSTNMSFVNGVMSQSISFTYILEPV